MITAWLSAPIHPTEDPERVARAISALFPDSSLEQGEKRVHGKARDLESFADAIRKAKIPDTARAVMLNRLTPDGRSTAFSVAKQVAFAGRLNLATVEGPLGDILVRIEADTDEELRNLIDRIAPDTRAHAYRAKLSERELREILESERGAVGSPPPWE